MLFQLQLSYLTRLGWPVLVSLPLLLGCALTERLAAPAPSPTAKSAAGVVEISGVPLPAARDETPSPPTLPGPSATPSPTASPTPAPTATNTPPAPLTLANINRLGETARTVLDGAVRDIAFSADGRWLALSVQPDPAAPAALRLLDTRTLAPVNLPQDIPAGQIAFSPDGRRVAVTFYREMQDHLEVWETEQLLQPGAAPLVTFTDSFGGIQDLAFSPDGRLIALAPATAQGSFVVLVEAETGQVRQKLQVAYQGTHPPLVQSVAFSPDGRWVAAGVYGGSVQLWPVTGGKAVLVVEPSGAQGSPVLFLDNNRLVAWLGSSQMAIWDRNGTRLVTLPGPAAPQTFDATPDRMLIAGAINEQVHFWRSDSGEPVRAIPAESAVQLLRFGPQGRLAVVDQTGTLYIWAVAAHQ